MIARRPSIPRGPRTVYQTIEHEPCSKYWLRIYRPTIFNSKNKAEKTLVADTFPPTLHCYIQSLAKSYHTQSQWDSIQEMVCVPPSLCFSRKECVEYFCQVWCRIVSYRILSCFLFGYRRIQYKTKQNKTKYYSTSYCTCMQWVLTSIAG